MSMLKIHKNDEVVVIAGKDKGKRGKVQKVSDNDKLLSAVINMVKKHQKPNVYLQQPGGSIEKEAGIQVSNVAIWNPKTEKSDRVGFKAVGKTKARIFKSTGENSDA